MLLLSVCLFDQIDIRIPFDLEDLIVANLLHRRNSGHRDRSRERRGKMTAECRQVEGGDTEQAEKEGRGEGAESTNNA